ncbi:hypothetical protein IEO21_10115 [Rhodonia placenta]|uniref:Uncharacterized protein n=1 Tax=Rhodonia placenta TaxID=104341 RepID=A0A8H7NT46_9APHY|nr:hypothetical protein IEO21_10115 [Postia placenta]
MEDVIHHGLEGHRRIGEAKEYHQGFVQPLVSYKGSLPLVTGFDPNIVVSPSNIKLCEERGTLELIYHLSDQRQWIAIFDGDHV